MTIISLLNLYCNSSLYRMQQAVCLLWIQLHKGVEDLQPKMNSLVIASLQAEEWIKSTSSRYSKQLWVSCWLLSALWIPSVKGIKETIATWAPDGLTNGNPRLPPPEPAKCMPATNWMPVLTWMGPNHKEMNRHRVNILLNKLGSAVVWRVRHVIYYLQEFGQPLA